jgi:hypothetical protein
MTRPRTEKTLASAAASFFQKHLTAQDVAAVIAAMQSMGFIAIADGKVSYKHSV